MSYLNSSIDMPAVAKGDKVLVTGANGFIAMWIVRSLLERGFSVRGTVRSLDKGTHVIEYFTSLGYGDKIDIVVVEDIAMVALFFHSIVSEQSCDRKERLIKPSRG